MAPDPDVTRLLHRLAGGELQAADELWPAVYNELHDLAGRCFQNESAGHTLQPTALVNEAFVRLVGSDPGNWENRTQFLAVAARAMRRILIDYARRRRAAKRGGEACQVPLSDSNEPAICPEDDVLVLDEALEKLSGFDPQLARLVELRFFGGLTFDETAKSLDVAPITAKRMWKMARGWLLRQISEED
jgi:RNA polymerase sigma factor (TIGR02999 family)